MFEVPCLSHVEVLPASIRFIFEGSIPPKDVSELQSFLTALCKETVQSFLNKIDKGSNVFRTGPHLHSQHMITIPSQTSQSLALA